MRGGLGVSSVRIHRVNEEIAGYRFLCRTEDTEKLDEIFGLCGDAVEGEQMRSILDHAERLPMFEDRETMRQFAVLGCVVGSMVGVKLDELDFGFVLGDYYLGDVLQRGYLTEVRSTKGVFVVPAAKFGEGYRAPVNPHLSEVI